MNDRSDLLSAYRTESAEHVEAIEAILLASQFDAPGDADIALLFRSFHSIKGLARVVGEEGVEALAHAAETLLSPIRAGALAIDAGALDLLLAAADGLKEGRVQIGWTPDPQLLDALHRAVAGAGAPGAGPAPAAAGPWRRLSEDRDLLVALAELFEELLPGVAAGLAAADDTGSLSDDLALLSGACAKLGLEGLRAAVDRVDAERSAPALAGLLARLETFERLAGCETGARAAREAADLPAGAPPDPVAEPTKAQAARLRLLDSLGVEPQWAAVAAAADLEVGAGRAIYELKMAWPEAAAERAAALRAVGQAAEIVAGKPARVGGRPGVALLVGAGADAAGLRQRLEGAPVDPEEVRRLDGKTSRAVAFAAAAQPAEAPAEDAQVRVPVQILDRLFGRVGEFFSVGSRLNGLVFDSEVAEILRRLSDYSVVKAPELLPAIEELIRHEREIAAVEAEVNRLTSLIHESTLGLRVLPLDALAARFPRMVRDTARAQAKQVRFEYRTNGIKVDKGMSDMLADPLMHMLRNAVDHGIEPESERLAAGKPATASLTLTAEQHGNRVVVQVSDDGRGIDIERVRRKAVASRLTTKEESLRLSDEQIARFIFSPGFSTAASVTEVSGRGVGMDVVLVNVTRLGGRIDIHTGAGEGTTIRLDMPLSAAIQPMLLAELAQQTVAFPEAVVAESIAAPAAAVQQLNGQRALLLHGAFLPLFRLAELLRLPAGEDGEAALGGDIPVVICEWRGRRIGVEVRRILRRHEMLIREAHPRVAALPGVGGISTIGADRIVIVIDPDDLFALAWKSHVSGLQAAAANVTLADAS